MEVLLCCCRLQDADAWNYLGIHLDFGVHTGGISSTLSREDASLSHCVGALREMNFATTEEAARSGRRSCVHVMEETR